MEDDIGYLPGTEKEKIEPLFRSSLDNLAILVDSDEEHRYDNERELQMKIDELFDRGIIDTQSIGYLRGRSIEQTLILVDEAQNTSANTAMSIVSRAGRGSKIIVCGDPEQIDNQYLDSRNNGISYLCEKMKYSPLCSVITTEEKDVTRSPLAKEVVRLCKNNEKV
jgi:PhoH-like ATPase